MELKKPSSLLSPSTLNTANNNSSNTQANGSNGAPLGMGAAHGNLGSPPGDAK